MSGDRAWTAPEMTPLVDPIDDKPDGEARDQRDALEPREPAPGEVPGPGGNVEGRSRIGATDEAEATDEGHGAERERPPV